MIEVFIDGSGEIRCFASDDRRRGPPAIRRETARPSHPRILHRRLSIDGPVSPCPCVAAWFSRPEKRRRAPFGSGVVAIGASQVMFQPLDQRRNTARCGGLREPRERLAEVTDDQDNDDDD